MNPNTSKSSVAAIALLAVAVAYRIIVGLLGQDAGWLPNFSPLAAIALCGAIYFPKRIAFVVPLAALFFSDLILNAHYGVSLASDGMVTRYVALGFVAALGLLVRSQPKFLSVMLASVAGSVFFFVLTNTGSWFTAPEYAKTFAGWIQSLTVGLPGYPPTWVFFRNALAGDLFFTAVFAGCLAFTSSRPLPRTLQERLHAGV